MTRQYKVKTNFTAGELDQRLLGRGDLRAWENGALRLRNVFLHPTGGVSRRDGLQFLAELPGPGRLIAFEFNTEQIYLLVFTHFRLDIYQDGELIAGNIDSPWWQAVLDEIVWVQSADTLFVSHPTMRTWLVTRTGAGEWSIDPMAFSNLGQRQQIPHHKFASREAELTPSGTTGTITLECTEPLFDEDHVGVAFRLHGGEVRVTEVISQTVAEADVRIDLEEATSTTDWTEAAFSNVRGWPATVAFHQNRMVLGGSRDLPNHVWMSQVDDIFNFDVGEGLDDEAIHFELLSDQVNAVRGMLSSTHLQIFTSGGEWMVSGDPLTPKTVQVSRQTQIGSRTDRYVPPRRVDGTTLFVSRSGDKLSEYALTDAEQSFMITDLALLAGRMVKDAIDLDYDGERRMVFAVLGNGGVATLTQFRTEEVTAWSRQDTAGTAHAVAVVREFVYLLVERASGYFLEVFEPAILLDSSLAGDADPPTETWSGLDHLEGETVAIVADGNWVSPKTVEDGTIVLDEPASQVEAGLAYRHEVVPLPPLARNALGTDYAIKVRLIRATFRLLETVDLRVDVGDGPRPVSFRTFGDDPPDAALEPFTGDTNVRALGWQPSGVEPLWRIDSEAPLPFTLLSVTSELKVND